MRRPNGVETHMAHRERLITAVAEDGLELDGVIIQPSTDKQQSLLVWIHGFGANFYFGPYLRVARAMAALGVASAVVNTRGHDLATLLQPRAGTPYWGGAAWEKLDESPLDIAGWVATATETGFSKVVLVGHSLGAVKATYYLAERQDERVVGLALAAPPLRPAWDSRDIPATAATFTPGSGIRARVTPVLGSRISRTVDPGSK